MINMYTHMYSRSNKILLFYIYYINYFYMMVTQTQVCITKVVVSLNCKLYYYLLYNSLIIHLML